MATARIIKATEGGKAGASKQPVKKAKLPTHRMMYIIQRKSDGLFYVEKGWEGAWTEDRYKVRLFKTTGSCRSARVWNNWKIVRTDIVCEDCDIEKERYRYHSDHSDHWERVKRTEDELLYRVVPVRVVLTIEK